MVLSYGLGVDSTAALTRLLTDPSIRDFDLDDLLVITAGTGQEWPTTHRLVEQHVLPLLARHNVRYLQVARRGPLEADGVDITADSRQPTRLHLVGAWTLADEMFDAGTVPQTCGDRICSQHFKGFALDTVIGALTQGRPYRHLMGYSFNERARAKRDSKYNTDLRVGEYPLVNWRWDRNRATRFLAAKLGASFVKSACTYCPFALSTVAGKADTVARFVADPTAGLLALAMEYTATCLNPTQGLINGTRLLDLLTDSRGTEEVLALFADYQATVPWALYDVRRTLTPRSDGRYNHARSVEILDVGSRQGMRAQLDTRARDLARPICVGDARFPRDRHTRVWLRRRSQETSQGEASTAVDAEHFLTVAPCTAVTKTGPAFPNAWKLANQYALSV